MTSSAATSPEILNAAQAAHLDLVALSARTDAILAEPLYWFPVRHHSPAVARRLAECIAERRPKIIFIEGPHEAQGMIEFLVDSKTRPPVAIYSSFRDDQAPPDPASAAAGPPRRSVWYPIVSYSPEYVAMSAAKKIGAAVVFMDLPHYAESAAPKAASPSPLLPVSPSSQRPADIDEPDANGPTGAPAPQKRLDLDQLASRSDFYRLLAKAAGHRSFSETWDRLFETTRYDQTHQEFRREVALFCAAVRATTPRALLESDGTLPRERFMWQTIQNTLKEKNIQPQDALVVCGGFHIFLDRNDPMPPPPIPQGTLSVTIAPYSYFRISELSGYGAGNRAPRFYELCFDHHAARAPQIQVVINYVIDVIKEARRRHEPLSPADAIGTTQHALMLARLRGRTEPVLDDILDALITCCCKGNPKNDATHLLEAIDEINIGTKLGKVTDRIGRLPIINDFYELLERYNLEEVAAREKVFTYTLDKRQPLDAAKSAFLHRLLFLGVGIGDVQRENAPFGQSLFKEHWRLKWTPKIEADLIERNLHGDTIETAATTMLRESLGSATVEAGPACRKLVQAVDMDLPELVSQAEANTGHAIDHDDRFHSLADALTSLIVLESFAAYRGLGKQRLADLIVRCFSRACVAVPEVASVPQEAWENVVQGLLALAEPVVQREDLDANLFAAHVERAARESTVPFLRGAFLGVLTEMRRFKPEQIAAELTHYGRGSPDQQILAGDFLQGVLRVSRTAILLGAKALVAALDELLQSASQDTFLSMVPRIRAAFESLHERQRDSVALHVAEIYGIKESTSLRFLTTTVAAAALMSELDSQVAAIMSDWLGEA